MNISLATINTVIIVLSVLIVLLFVAYIYNSYLPGIRISFLGSRNYRITFIYGDVAKIGFQDVNQAKNARYFLKKIVKHISGDGLVEFFRTKNDVQALADEYYHNLQIAYSIYKDYKKGNVDQVKYEKYIAFMEEQNRIILLKFKKLNQETVDFINFIEECIEDNEYDIDYDVSNIDDYLKIGEDNDDDYDDDDDYEDDEEDENDLRNEEIEEDNNETTTKG